MRIGDEEGSCDWLLGSLLLPVWIKAMTVSYIEQSYLSAVKCNSIRQVLLSANLQRCIICLDTKKYKWTQRQSSRINARIVEHTLCEYKKKQLNIYIKRYKFVLFVFNVCIELYLVYTQLLYLFPQTFHRYDD